MSRELSPQDSERWMRLALELAEQAARQDEVPVGAVVVRNNELLGSGHDLRVQLNDPTAHAEVLALRQAAQRIGDWRLEDCALIVTLEPCPMCAGAALLARIPLIMYGARNPKFGAVETQMSILSHPGWNHRVRTTAGILEPECAAVMQSYFRTKRT